MLTQLTLFLQAHPDLAVGLYLGLLLLACLLLSAYHRWRCGRDQHSVSWPELGTCEWCGADVPWVEEPVAPSETEDLPAHPVSDGRTGSEL